MLDIKIELTKIKKEKPKDYSKIGFGKVFSDHMFVMDYKPSVGWCDPRVIPYQPFSLDPACVVFHYAQEVFEGLKAYRKSDDEIQLFRPYKNADRFIKSCDRLSIPRIEKEDFVKAVKTLVEVDKEWVPKEKDTSYYIRPFIFASDVGLGVHASKEYKFVIIGGPSGAYYENGLEPIRIYVEDEYIRSAPGLTGFAKCGGNYAGSIAAGEKAKHMGYSQVLWLDGIHKKYVEEVGAMNIMFKIDGVVYTSKCGVTVLDGVTRSSCIDLLRSWSIDVIEKDISIDEIMSAGRCGKLEEVFGTGTAAVISPIKELSYKGESVIINDGKIGDTTQKLYDTLTGIQWGRVKDEFGWIESL